MLQKVKNWWHWLTAIAANLWFGWPSRKLKIIGVTGTDGKTTTVTLINHILTKADHKIGFISTIESQIGGQRAPSLHTTTPSPWQLQHLLKKAVMASLEYMVLEVSSHGLDQNRLAGINFEIGVLTNLSREHLDYHKTMARYLAAKAKLFLRSKTAILNSDDQSFNSLKFKNSKVITYGIKKKADFTPKNFPFKTKLPGQYNQSNCLAAIAAAATLGLPKTTIRQAVASFQGIRGRMEEIKTNQSFKVFVDFGHTPNALKQVLTMAKKLSSGRLIHVFGCTGERDPGKRPLMGKISAQLADKIILTSEDTYHENPHAIISAIEKGIKGKGKMPDEDYWTISDRQKAIQKAIQLAQKNDLVLITGVGHQTTLNLGGQEVPWSDQKAVLKALKK